MDSKITGNIIATKRKAKGLNQIQLGELLNVSNRTISKWEKGDGFPDITILPELAKVLDVTIDELLTGEKPQPKEIYVEKSNADKLLREFKICFVISLFLGAFGALFGTITEVYSIWAFPILFYTHWEIMFVAISFFAVVASGLVFTLGVIRLNFEYSKRETLAIAGKKAIILTAILLVFPLSFIARIIDFSRWGAFTPYIVLVLVAVIVLLLVKCYEKIKGI